MDGDHALRRGGRPMVASEARRPRATVRAKAQLTLPPEIRDALQIREGDEVEFTITEAGEVLLRGMIQCAC